MSSSTAHAGAWRNGFDALGTLDSDGDGQLAGEELSDISLWYDGGVRGLAELGEVRPIETAGIIALYYRTEKAHLHKSDLILDVGFKRTLGAKTVTGRSVDWSSSASEMPLTVIAKMSHLATLVKEDALIRVAYETAALKKPITTDAERKSVELFSRLRGKVWAWSYKS